MAKLNFKYSTMNSGKTLDLLRTAHNYEENGYKVIVIKSKVDTKSSNKIVTRLGLERKVDYIVDIKDNILKTLEGKLDDVKVIFVDEAQFLTKEQIDDLFVITKVFDIPVICYGLRTNFKMETFEGSARLLAIAENLEELKTICSCGKTARFAARILDGKYVTEGESVLIDGAKNVSYEPVCGDCYLKKVKSINYKK